MKPFSPSINCLVAEVSKPIGLCLINIGAALNVTSMEVINRLLTYVKKNVGAVELVGGEQMSINGVTENVQLKIGDALVIFDLHIMEIRIDRIGETIFGTGFLRSVGAVTDFDARRMSFNKIDPTKFYNWVDISDE